MTPTSVGARIDVRDEFALASLVALEEVVVLGYLASNDICQATKPHLERIQDEYGFDMARISCDTGISWDKAGILAPSVTVFRRGNRVAPPLLGAQTRKNILKYLAETGVIENEQ